MAWKSSMACTCTAQPWAAASVRRLCCAGSFCAACHWGLAIGLAHKVGPLDGSEYAQAKAAVDTAITLKGRASLVEQDLIKALALRYRRAPVMQDAGEHGPGCHPSDQMDKVVEQEKSAYVRAMRKVMDKHPQDPDVKVLLTLDGSNFPLGVKNTLNGGDIPVAWINTNTWLTRHNLGRLLTTGENALRTMARKPAGKKLAGRAMARLSPHAADPDKIFPAEARRSTDRLLAEVERRFINGPLQAKDRAALGDYLRAQGTLDDHDLLGFVRLAMCTPAYQLI